MVSQHIEPEAREVYERMIEVFFYFKPTDDLKETVHQEFFGYGTAAHEFFQSRKELQKMAKLQAEQLREQNFKISRKKVLEKLLADGTSCLIVEEFDLYLSESDHQMQMRLSTILERTDEEWLVTHFHGSTPDSDIDDTEALPLEGLRKKNEELEARIKERTRDLEIEAALEKVRSRTMTMQNSGELPEAANLLFLEIQALGIPAWSCGYNILADDKKSATCWMSSEGALQKPFTLRLFGEASFEKMGDFLRSKDTFLVQELGGKALIEHYDHMKSFPDLLPTFEDLEAKGLSLPTYQINHLCKFSHGFLLFITYEPVPEAHDIFKRFNSVFEQTYTRFLDLQKAEAQAREANIESALEKVRSRTMSMHKSEELAETALVLYEQFKELGNIPDRMSIGIFKEETKEIELWVTDQSGSQLNQRFTGSWKQSAVMTNIYKSWKSGNNSFVADLSGQKLNVWLKYIREEMKLFVDDTHIEGRRVQQAAFFSHGFLLITTNEPVAKEIMQLLVRFADVFSQTYTRFLDLQKAEAQTREAQIESALERVRSRSMAMHKSEELAELSLELVKQVQALGVATWFCAFNIYDDDPKGSLEWGSNGQGTFPKYRTPREGVFLRYYEAGKRGKTLLINEIGEDECPAHYEYLCTLPGVGEQLLKMKDAGIPFPVSQIDHVAYFKYGYVLFITYEPAPESHEIFIRFAKVFEQTYTRFLDLKKAEGQAREAQIENALEKVRSRTMAMQQSTELGEASNNLFLQVQALGIPAWSAGYCIWETEDMKTASCSMSSEGEFQKSFSLPTIGEGYNFYDPAIKGESFYVKEIGGKALEKHYEFMRTLPTVGETLDILLNAGLSLPTFQIFHIVFFLHGYLMFITYEPVPEAHEIFKRFGKVFEQTYTRFLDLKKAEAQAREAKIETALERVRSKTMAMHSSQDVGATVVTLFDEVQKLELDDSIRCGIGILEGTEKMETWSANATPEGEVDLKTGMLDMSIHPMLVGLKKAWKSGKKGYTYEYKDGDVRRYYSRLNKEPEYPFYVDLDSLPDRVFHESFFYSAGILFAFTENPLSEEASKILERFARVFGQTYRRYLDLLKAEKQARDALKQATLDRVRGQIASMRSTDDLERITPLIWNELTALEIPFIRCGVFIIDESDKTVQAFLSAPDGHSLGAMRIPFDADKDTAATVAHWKKEEVYKTHWDKSQFLEFMQLMIDLGQVSNEKEYQGAEQPPDSLHLHFVPFTQGMLYVGNVESLEQEQIELVQTLADAFAIAYARYEDFVRLEKAKKQVENTLEDLKSAQNQLVQSEKMASLGELTAGIAHEIQNPLNFVNNFSEVSVELLEELQEEMSKGDFEEVNALIEDIQQNLDKINHHGKRADGIVKGMLQHSRASSGEKELTDLNILADEYLRLAYHGLRAKDKTFNANIKTHFDEGLGKVNVIPQDIGRVILNLITNAFYVVKEKGEQQPEGYEPTVTVTTIKKKDKVLLRVKDNGNGIPEKIQDKIFQPFFTTKPTGEGTGLGLSMSYDIVTKGHGGDLKVESDEGTGTTMTVSLPIQKISES